MMPAARLVRFALTFLFAIVAVAWCYPRPDADDILRRSLEPGERDWQAAPEYDYFQRDQTPGGSKTYHVLMIEGSPYQELVAVNGERLSAQDQASQQLKLEQVISQRRAESPGAHARRIAAYQRDRKRDHLMLQQLTRAFKFKFIGERRVRGYSVYLLQATPLPGYQPPNYQTEVLTGMQGRLWIDKQTYQWVKVEAMVVHPVSIAGFLARVEPGTRFELDKMPVADGIWLPSHFAMRSFSKIFFLFHHHSQENETYFNYQKAGGGIPPG